MIVFKSSDNESQKFKINHKIMNVEMKRNKLRTRSRGNAGWTYDFEQIIKIIIKPSPPVARRPLQRRRHGFPFSFCYRYSICV